MAISLSSIVQRNIDSKPPRILIYGVSGVGKTTFASQAPNPLFVPLEDGLGRLKVERAKKPETLEQLIEIFDLLLTDQHDHKSIVIDSLDWLEPLVHQYVCRQQGWDSIESPGYGKGYKAATDIWRAYLDKLYQLRDAGMFVIQIAHSQIKRFDSPDSESYDRYQVKLHEQASALVKEWSDVVLFANYIVSTKSDKGRKIRGVGVGDRALYTSQRPAYDAKNRLQLPHQIGLSWQSFIDSVGTEEL